MLNLWNLIWQHKNKQSNSHTHPTSHSTTVRNRQHGATRDFHPKSWAKQQRQIQHSAFNTRNDSRTQEATSKQLHPTNIRKVSTRRKYREAQVRETENWNACELVTWRLQNKSSINGSPALRNIDSPTGKPTSAPRAALFWIIAR